MDKWLSIIIPAWRGLSSDKLYLRTLLNSIQDNLTLPYEVVVVCNSQDPVLAEVVQTHPTVTRYCLNSANVGVARAWNMGSHMAEGDVLCYMNEDVVLGRDCLETLVGTLHVLSNVGVIGVEGGNVDLDSDGTIRTRKRIISGPPQYCDVVSGFLFLMSKEVYYRIGGFDDELTPCLYEEFDLAFRVRDAGYRCYIIPDLDYHHAWGVSGSKSRDSIEYMGRRESIESINRRNRHRFATRWAKELPFTSAVDSESYNAQYYSNEYFERSSYIETMAKSRLVHGKWEQPLAKTMADMIDAIASIHNVEGILELGCAYGFVIQELVKRGYDAWGVDFSANCVENSPVPDRLMLCDVRELPLERQYDLILASNLFEHLTDEDARQVVQRVRKASRLFFTTINKSDHDPSHVNLKPNWRWIILFKECGFLYEPNVTNRARSTYLEKSSGTERWHRDCLIFVREDDDIVALNLRWWMTFVKEFMGDMRDELIHQMVQARQKIISVSSQLTLTARRIIR